VPQGGVGASGGAYDGAAAALVSAWHGWRRHTPAPLVPLLLSPPTPPLGLPGAGQGPTTAGATATAGYSDGQCGGGVQVSAHVARWARQRDSALQPLGRAAATGSRLVADCALGPRPLLDALSGKRLQWEAADVSFEDVDGSFATAELSGDEGGKHGGSGKDAAAARRETAGARKVWRGSCPPSGGMWKRVRMGQ
jgi:hypothetical protein